MSNIRPIFLPKVETVDELRQMLSVTLNRLAQDLNKPSGDTDMFNNRIKNLSAPAANHDAINLTYLEDYVKSHAVEPAPSNTVTIDTVQRISGQKTFSAATTIFTGKVGIGTTSPNVKLAVMTGSDMIRYNDAGIAGPYMEFLRYRGSESFPAIVQNGDEIGKLTFWGYDGSTIRLAAKIISYVDGTPGTSDMPGSLVFQTTPDGSVSPATAMTILNSGNVGIGMSPGAYKVDVAGDVNVSGGYYVGGVPLGTSLSNSVLTAACSAQLALTTSYQDVAGATLALDRIGTWMVTASFMAVRGINDTGVIGRLDVDGSPVGRLVKLGGAIAVADQLNISQTWVVTIASQPKTIKLQAVKLGTGVSVIEADDTTLTALWVV